MNNIIRRVTTAATAALALGAGSALATTSATSAAGAATTPRASATHARATASTMPRCGINQVHTWLRETGSDAHGTWYRIEFTNRRSFACALRGYPGVSALNSAHAQIGQPAARHAGFPGGTRAADIPAHGTDSAVLEVVNPGVFKGGAPEKAAALRAFMPGDGYAESVPFRGLVTSRGHSNLYVGTVRYGADN